MRKNTSIGMETASPQRSDAMTKSAVVARNRRTWPKRSVSQPVSGTEIAFATANEVMIQVPWLGETPRSPAIAGIDTLAIDVSSTFMNVASPTASDAATRAPPSSGLTTAACAMRGLRRLCRLCRRGGDRRHVGVLGDDALDALVRLRVYRGECLGLVGRRFARHALQAAGGAVVRIDVDLHRQADLQRVLGELLAIERDPHRHALHHLYPVAARVLRRQERERASRAGAEAGDAAVE